MAISAKEHESLDVFLIIDVFLDVLLIIETRFLSDGWHEASFRDRVVRSLQRCFRPTQGTLKTTSIASGDSPNTAEMVKWQQIAGFAQH